MSKFIKIVVNNKLNLLENYNYLYMTFALYQRFARFLHDDYFLKKDYSLMESFLDLVQRASPYFWVILDEKTGNVAGFVFLENWVGSDLKSHSVEIVTCFHPFYWGDYTKACAKHFISYCFDTYDLYKIKAIVFSQNTRVRKLLEYVGFEKEASLKGETINKGRPQDVEVFSIFNKQCERGKYEI